LASSSFPSFASQISILTRNTTTFVFLFASRIVDQSIYGTASLTCTCWNS